MLLYHNNFFVTQTGIEKNVFGNNPVSLAARHVSTESSVTKDDVGNGYIKPSNTDIVEIDVPSSANHIRSPTSGGVSDFFYYKILL